VDLVINKKCKNAEQSIQSQTELASMVNETTRLKEFFELSNQKDEFYATLGQIH
jgi:hypothetical protein